MPMPVARSFAYISLISFAFATSAVAWGATLEVEITDIRSRDGQLLVAVHSSAEGWDGEAAPAAVRLHVPTADHALLRFDNLAPGRYAVQVLHDQNGNGRLDSNFLGRPIERYGASNNPEVMRKPTFDEARVDVSEGNTRIELRLR